MEQGDQHSTTRCADRMTQGNGATVDIDSTGVPAQFLTDSQGLRGEGFVGFDQLDLVERPASLGQATRPMTAGSTPALA
jgi:hypothetical protein